MLGLGSRSLGESQTFVAPAVAAPITIPISPVNKTALSSALILAQAAITAAGTLANLTLAQLAPVRAAVSTALASFASAIASLDAAITTTSVAGATTSTVQAVTHASPTDGSIGVSGLADVASTNVIPAAQVGVAVPVMVTAILAQATYIRQMGVLLNAQGYLARINTNLQNATG